MQNLFFLLISCNSMIVTGEKKNTTRWFIRYRVVPARQEWDLTRQDNSVPKNDGVGFSFRQKLTNLSNHENKPDHRLLDCQFS